LAASDAETVLESNPSLPSRRWRKDQLPPPLIDMLWLICRSALPLNELAILLPELDKIPPAGPSIGPCTGVAPRSPTPGIPERPTVGDCGRKLTESEILKTQLRVTSPWDTAALEK
jgi:hypothetical protein